MQGIKVNAYERLYKKLDKEERETCIYKLGRIRERKSGDLRNVKCIRNEDNKFSLERIKESWITTFTNFIVKPSQKRRLDDTYPPSNIYISVESRSRIKNALKK